MDPIPGQTRGSAKGWTSEQETLFTQAGMSVRRLEHPTKRSGPVSSLRRVSTSRVLAGVAVMLIVFAAVILGGVYYMLVAELDELDSELDTQVETVQRDFDRDVRRLQRNLERELDARLPAVPAPASP